MASERLTDSELGVLREQLRACNPASRMGRQLRRLLDEHAELRERVKELERACEHYTTVYVSRLAYDGVTAGLREAEKRVAELEARMPTDPQSEALRRRPDQEPR